MFLVLFWGLAFVAIKQALVHMSWFTLTFLRFALALAGLAVMISLARPESQFRFQASEGALAVIPSAVFSALYAAFGKRYLGRYPPVTLVAWTLLIGTALLLPLIAVTASAFIDD